MNSSLKATVLEYIYKWTEKGWDIQRVSELYSSPKRQTQDKLYKDTSVPIKAGNIIHRIYTRLTFVGLLAFFMLNTTLLFWSKTKCKINADNFSFDMIFLVNNKMADNFLIILHHVNSKVKV